MLDKIFDKAEQAINRLNQATTNFEKDFDRVKSKFDGEFESFHNRVNAEIQSFRAGIDNTLNETMEKIQTVRVETQDILSTQSLKLDDLIKDKVKDFEDIAVQKLDEFANKGQDCVEGLKKVLHEKYEAFEKQAYTDAEKAFETDIVAIFDKYGDKIAPYMFKSLVRYVNPFGKKK